MGVLMIIVINVKQACIAGRPRLVLDFSHCAALVKHFQNIKGACWCAALAQLNIPFYCNHLDYLQKKFGQFAVFYNIDNGQKTLLRSTSSAQASSRIPPVFHQQMRLKRYSQNTQRTYTSVLSKFLQYWHTVPPEDINNEQIRDYMVYLGRELDEVVVTSPFKVT